MWFRNVVSTVTIFTAVVLLLPLRADGEAPYYRDKTIRFIVGNPPGGGHDLYTRLMARHMPRHIPGNPKTIVQNMPGGGTVIAANYLYNVAKPDGLTIGKWAAALIRQQVMGRRGLEFDSRKFGWVGAPAQDHLVCAFTKASGFTSWDQVMRTTPDKPLIVGGMALGTSVSDDPRLLQAALGFPVKMVDGYGGTADIRRAADAGEVHGGCWGWESVRVTWSYALEAGDAHVLLQIARRNHPDLPHVPNAFDLAETEEVRMLLRTAADNGQLQRAYAMPPGTPKELLQTIRQAFMATMRDREFLAAAEKAGFDINPLTGEEVEKLVHGLFETPPEIVKKLVALLLPK